MKISNIVSILDSYTPLEDAYEFDNPGLQIGFKNNELKNILICLDLTSLAIDKAIKTNSNFIITHHPLLFNPIKNIFDDDVISNLIIKCIKNEISVYSMHTNFDRKEVGIADYLAQKNNLKVESDLVDKLGVICTIKGEEPLSNFIEKFKANSDIKKLSASSDLKQIIKRIAILNGSGARDESIAYLLRDKNVDLFISSEFKYSLALLLSELNIAFIEITHFDSEKYFVNIVYDFLNTLKNLQDNKISVYNDIIYSQKEGI